MSYKYKSTTHYLLAALVPYTDPNLKLLFKPNVFFNDIERMGEVNVARKSLETSYYRMIQNDLIDFSDDKQPRLTEKGKVQLKRYQPKKLSAGAKLLLVFDIPENERAKRNYLRTLLRELKFTQVQRSVWQTEYDSLECLRSEVSANGLTAYVNIYESSQVQL